MQKAKLECPQVLPKGASRTKLRGQKLTAKRLVKHKPMNTIASELLGCVFHEVPPFLALDTVALVMRCDLLPGSRGIRRWCWLR